MAKSVCSHGDDVFCSHLPLVMIDTDGRDIPGKRYRNENGEMAFTTAPDGSDLIKAKISIIDSADENNHLDSVPVMSSDMLIHIRGNSSRAFDKSGYSVRLITEDGKNNPQPVMGMQGTLTRLAETDILTRLQNRRCYERRIPVYPTLCRRSLACIYADVNGLHEINEVEGHEAGDIMLKYTADVLKEQFGDFHTYRIGGDEFVAFAVDTDAESIENKLKTFKEKLEARGYFASVGYEIHSVDSIDNTSLIKAAENKMYSEKQEFYNGRSASLRRHPRYFTGNAESDKLS